MKVTIIGVGKVGTEIARRLSAEGHDIIVIDRNEDHLAKAGETLDVMVIRGNGSDSHLLGSEEIRDSDLLVAVTSSDEINMISCMIAKRVGITRTIARVRDPDYARNLVISKEDLGIDLVINPDYAASLEISRFLTLNLSVYSEPFAGGKIQMVELPIDESHQQFINKRIMDIEIPKTCLIVGISRMGETIIPGGQDFIRQGDTIYLLGNAETVERICSRFKVKRQKLHNVMILGGSRIGLYLAEKMSSQGVKVKLIEQNREKSLDLADRLQDVMIINGDGTDVDLLKKEGIHDTDGFVAVTGFDEENLLMALLAKQLGAKRVVAKVSRPSYAPLVERLGVDTAISPILITIGEIMRFIRGGRLLTLVLLLNEQAEVMEVIVQPSSRISGRTLKSAGLPRGVVVGAISRGNKVIIPRGNEEIKVGDRLVVFALGNAVHVVEDLCGAGGKAIEP